MRNFDNERVCFVSKVAFGGENQQMKERVNFFYEESNN